MNSVIRFCLCLFLSNLLFAVPTSAQGLEISVTFFPSEVAEWYYVTETPSEVAEWYYFTERPSTVAKGGLFCTQTRER